MVGSAKGSENYRSLFSFIRIGLDVRRSLDARPQFGDLAVQCTASIGMAWAGHREGVGTLFRDAEWAMYEARRLGGARCVAFEPLAGGGP